MAGDRSRYGLAGLRARRDRAGGLGVPALVRGELHRHGDRLSSSSRRSGRSAVRQRRAAELRERSLHGTLDGLAGQQVAALSAHQALHELNMILLVLAGLALLDSLLRWRAPVTTVPAGAGASVAVLGALAAVSCSTAWSSRPTPGRRAPVALAARGRLAGAARLADDGRGGLWPRCSQLRRAALEAQLQRRLVSGFPAGLPALRS